jgi:hypothetical protein
MMVHYNYVVLIAKINRKYHSIFLRLEYYDRCPSKKYYDRCVGYRIRY